MVAAGRLERAARGAVRFERNEFMERQLEMRATRPESFAGLSPAAKLALGHYEAAKRRQALLATEERGSDEYEPIPSGD